MAGVTLRRTRSTAAMRAGSAVTTPVSPATQEPNFVFLSRGAGITRALDPRRGGATGAVEEERPRSARRPSAQHRCWRHSGSADGSWPRRSHPFRRGVGGVADAEGIQSAPNPPVVDRCEGDSERSEPGRRSLLVSFGTQGMPPSIDAGGIRRGGKRLGDRRQGSWVSEPGGRSRVAGRVGVRKGSALPMSEGFLAVGRAPATAGGHAGSVARAGNLASWPVNAGDEARAVSWGRRGRGAGEATKQGLDTPRHGRVLGQGVGS
ncbi:uncharacterized protein CMC5_049030 [Chondromyces crocatus]|uniref:Uncharacterized protein n=1 Tax=Chondromyces crocatus TaxID=52 RepID=A0A0K1EJ95_CHOCO|nr:uncharacterized protein CMC5_049030 [Chondromyces crocatus]